MIPDTITRLVYVQAVSYTHLYGLSMVFHHLWGWETEIAALCMDVPLLLLGIYFLGGMFGVKTIIDRKSVV